MTAAARKPTATTDAEAAPLTASTGLPADALASDPDAAETQKAVKTQIDQETEQGFRGVKVDPTPNHNYTLQGVTDPGTHVPEEYKTQTGVTVYPRDVVADNA